MRSQTWSRKALSCVTMRIVIFLVPCKSTSDSHWTPARDRKLVGSSSRSTSGSWTSAAANATRLRSPPDNLAKLCSCKCHTRSLVATSSARVRTSHPLNWSIAAAASANFSGLSSAFCIACRYWRTAT
mmetsp:Transcript_4796/g.10203  ORF Transcript_4796/g.10203 Transcript_4796/m.10203 type:complete len:128 (-) Transcript_4796:491-874(-)